MQGKLNRIVYVFVLDFSVDEMVPSPLIWPKSETYLISESYTLFSQILLVNIS